MRKMILVLAFLLGAMFLPSRAEAQANLRLQWDHDGLNTTGFELVGCPASLPVSLDGCVITEVLGPQARWHVIEGQPVGEVFFRARAYNQGIPDTLRAYSGFSNELRVVVPVNPNNPTNLIPVNADMQLIAYTLPADRNAVVTLTLEKIPSTPPEVP